MGKYNFDEIIKRRGSGCMKWDSGGNDDTLPMWVADMDFAVAPEIRAGLQKRLDHPIYGYSVAFDDYYGSICDWMDKRFGYRPDPAWFSHCPGIVPALHFFCKCLFRPGEKVLMQMPVYYPFFGAAKRNGVEVLENKLQLRDGRYEIDFADFEAKAKDPACKAFFLCSPHNPGGRMWTREELRKMGEICCANGVVIVSDEIHCDLVFKHHGKKHIPTASISEEIARNSITCVAPSKTFNLAGLQTSALIIPNPELKAVYDTFLASLGIMRPGAFGIAGLTAAFRYGEPWLEELLDYLGGNLDFLRGWLAENLPAIKIIEPDATYLVWMDFRAMQVDSRAFHEALLNDGNVWLDEGYIFGETGEGFERINIACPRSMLEEGLVRMKKGLIKAGLLE